MGSGFHVAEGCGEGVGHSGVKPMQFRAPIPSLGWDPHIKPSDGQVGTHGKVMPPW